MENKGKLSSQDIQIQGLLDRYLKLRAADGGAAPRDQHLDEDSLTAFVEGTLSRRESTSVVSHLVDCNFCRHVTAELVKLDYAFAGEAARIPVPDDPPAGVSQVLSGILSKIFGSGESSVFAHQQKDKDEEEDTEEKKG